MTWTNDDSGNEQRDTAGRAKVALLMAASVLTDGMSEDQLPPPGAPTLAF